MGVLVSWLYRLTGRQDNCLYCVIYCSTAQLLTAKCYFLFGFRIDLICFKGVVMCTSSLMLNHLDLPIALFNWKWHHVSCFRWCLNQIVDERETLFWKSLKFCLFIQFYHSCWVFERGWKKDFTLSSLWCNCREILIFSYTYCGILYLFFLWGKVSDGLDDWHHQLLFQRLFWSTLQSNIYQFFSLNIQLLFVKVRL